MILLLMSLYQVAVYAQHSHQHNDPKDTGHHLAADTVTIPPVNTTQNVQPEPLATFPTLHPLVVHIPIMLLILAALIQWISFLVYKKELRWTAWALLLIGFIGAYASSNWFHPHTVTLPTHTQLLLTQHELYAGYTIWASGVALLLQSLHLFIFKGKTWISLVTAILITISAVFVAISAHHGAELVHKHGVGPQGKWLEPHQH